MKEILETRNFTPIPDSGGNQKPENSPKSEVKSAQPKGVKFLSEYLGILYSDVPEKHRLVEWVKHLENKQKLNPLSEEPSAVKTALAVDDWANLIVKRFDKGNDKFWYEKEKNDFPVVIKALGEKFLPETKFVDTEQVSEEKRYYVVQDKIQGKHQQEAADAAIQRIQASMSQEEIEEAYVKNPNNWVKFRGEIFKQGLTNPEIWKTAQSEAKELYSRLKELEKTHVIDDLDFFVTNEGQIKLIDFQLHDKNEPLPEQAFPVGSEEIKIFFGLEEL